jgi:hypothetical protein
MPPDPPRGLGAMRLRYQELMAPPLLSQSVLRPCMHYHMLVSNKKKKKPKTKTNKQKTK